MAMKCLRRTVRNPFSVEGPGLACGFIKGYLNHVPQFEDRNVIHYVREEQWRAVTFRQSLWSKRAVASGAQK